MTAIAVALMPLVLLAVEDWRNGRRPRTLALAAAGGSSCTGCKPWQGGTLVLVIVAAEALSWRRSGVRPAAGCSWCSPRVVSRVYYAALERTDAAWELAGQVNAAGNQAAWSWPWWAIALTLAPLALFGRAGLPHASRDVAGHRGARVAARGAARLPDAGRHVPLPRVPGMAIPLGGSPSRACCRRGRGRAPRCRRRPVPMVSRDRAPLR
jgi:hypothetical protein